MASQRRGKSHMLAKPQVDTIADVAHENIGHDDEEDQEQREPASLF